MIVESYCPGIPLPVDTFEKNKKKKKNLSLSVVNDLKQSSADIFLVASSDIC